MGTSIKLKPELWKRVKLAAQAAGYSSPREFVEHVLEKEVARLEDASSDKDVLNKMKGLGYLG